MCDTGNTNTTKRGKSDPMKFDPLGVGSQTRHYRLSAIAIGITSNKGSSNTDHLISKHFQSSNASHQMSNDWSGRPNLLKSPSKPGGVLRESRCPRDPLFIGPYLPHTSTGRRTPPRLRPPLWARRLMLRSGRPRVTLNLGAAP